MDDLSIEHPELADLFDEGDGELPPEVREHASRCRICADEIALLTELRQRARALPRELEPGRDLWRGIAERISGVPPGAGTDAPPGVVPLQPGRPEAAPRRAPWGWLAAAAVLLVAFTSGATALWLGARSGAGAPIALAGAAAAPPRPVGLAAFASSAPEYRSAVESLEAELAARRESLSPETIRIVEQNLAIIDDAIAEARSALAADPTSAELPLLLAGVYRQKVELLREVVALTARS